ncbi:MAG: winged helix-turn-helix transcriptional regulator [Spirochaetes bacterium]|jgi:DNA-binding MarR family transcriptional regulator|nr:winged helix-turn-helix transcriptional regulator [Spirochaetota bacterium]
MEKKPSYRTPKIPLGRRELDEALFLALRAVYLFERSKVEHFELSFEEIYLLQYLRRTSPSKMSAIAGEMGIPVSTATRLVARMCRMRLVNRWRDGADGRIVNVSLTDNGEAAVSAVERHTFEVISANVRRFTSEDIAAFIKTAQCLGDILGAEPVPRPKAAGGKIDHA